MYGISQPLKWVREWEKETGRNFDDIFNEFMNDKTHDRIIRRKDGVVCQFKSKNGKQLIIGKIVKDVNREGVIEFKEIAMADMGEIEDAVYRHFGLEGTFHYYLVIPEK